MGRASNEVERLRAVIRAQSAINASASGLQEVMRRVAEEAQQLTDAGAAVVELAEGDDMVYRAASGSATAHVGLRLSVHASLSGLSVRTGRVLRCDDSDDDPRVDAAACRRVGARSMVVAPLVHQGAAVGALKVMSAEPGAFTDDDVDVLEVLAEFIAAAVTNARNSDLHARRAAEDPLTGLVNRTLLLDRMRHALAGVDRRRGDVGVFFIDLDRFKPVNDRFGHATGDAVLREVAHRLTAAVRGCDTVARVGGDEFVVVCDDLAAGASSVLADRLQAALEQPVPTEAGDVAVGASVGVAVAPTFEAAETLLARADAAMYAEKWRRNATEPLAAT